MLAFFIIPYGKGDMSISVLRLSCLLFIASLTVGCSSVPSESNTGDTLETSEYVEESHPNDPFEGFNRAMWDINYEYLDPYLVRPVSLAYVGYTPVPVRSGISNFLANLDEPASMVNNLFMGNGEKALDHFNRFWINSTIGLLGLIDIASEAGITKYDDNSSIRYKGQFKDGTPIGKFTYYYPTGEASSTMDFSKEGAKAVCKMYHKNGSIMALGNYINRQKDSTWGFFNDRKQVLRQETYKNDLLHGKSIV